MPSASPSARPWTLIGLAIALFGLPAIVLAHRLLASDPGATGGVVLREVAILALVAGLLWIVAKRERRPLSSIGLSFDHAGRSLAWSLVALLMIIVGIIAVLGLFSALGVSYGEDTGGLLPASMWAMLLTVCRAGIAEEVFYRGFAIERLESLTGSKWLAAGISLILFAGFHYR